MWNKGGKIEWLLELQTIECDSSNLEMYSVMNRNEIDAEDKLMNQIDLGTLRLSGNSVIFMSDDCSLCIPLWVTSLLRKLVEQ